MQYSYSYKALNDLGKLPRELQTRITEKLEFIFENNLLATHSRPLAGSKSGCSRIRIGDYRAIFHIQTTGIAVVIKVAHRKDIYNL